MAARRQNFALSSEGDQRDKMFPHYKASPASHQSGPSESLQESRRIMSVLRDWTEANQRSASTSEIKVNRVGKGDLINREVCPTSPRGERRMTPDLIRVSPQQQMAYQSGKVSRTPESYLNSRPLSAEVPKSSVDNKIYQPSYSDDYKVQRRLESNQFCIPNVQGRSFSNPTYSRVDSPTPSEGDFYSKENIRSISQMLLLTSPEAKSTPSQNDFTEHWFEDRSGPGPNASSFDLSSNENSSLYTNRSYSNPDSFRFRSFSTQRKQISNNTSGICPTSQVLPLSNRSPSFYSENASLSNLGKSSPKFVETTEINDSLLLSPKFKALRIANSSDSTQSSPQIPRKSAMSSYCADRESKNSLDSSTLSIATSWSSGLGIPFHQSHSSTTLSTPSPTQKFHSGSMENFRRHSGPNVEENDRRDNDDMFPWLVSKVAKPKEISSKSLKHISHQSSKIHSERKPSTEIQSSVPSAHSRHRNGYQSGTLGGGPYIYPPQYPSIPRAKPNEDTAKKLTDKATWETDHETQFQQHSCCNCSCHEKSAPSWKASGVKAPFPPLLFDQNQNIVDSSGDNKHQHVENVQTLHPVNRIHEKEFWGESNEDLSKRGNAYNIRGGCISDREEQSSSFKEYASPICTDPKCFPLPSTPMSIQKTLPGSEDKSNILTSTDGSQFVFEGNQNIDLYATTAFDKTLQSDHVSNRRNTWHGKEKPYSSKLNAVQNKLQQYECYDRSVNGISQQQSDLRISLEKCSNLSHEISVPLSNSPRSPPTSPNRTRPPLPKRDLSITLSNKTKRSPLSLPPYTSDFFSDDMSTHDMSPHDVSPPGMSPLDEGYSQNQGWSKGFHTDLYAPKRADWNCNQGANEELFRKFQGGSSISDGSCFNGGAYAADSISREGNKIDSEQGNENKWGINQQPQHLKAAWGETDGMNSKHSRAGSILNQSLDSVKEREPSDLLDGLTEYENVALIYVDRISRGLGSFKGNANTGPINGGHTIEGKLNHLTYGMAGSKTMEGNVKNIISKLESQGSTIPHWSPMNNVSETEQDQRYSEGTHLSMSPSSHPMSSFSRDHSVYDVTTDGTKKSSTMTSTARDKPVSSSKKDSVTSRIVHTSLSPKSLNVLPTTSDKVYYQSSGSTHSTEISVLPTRRYHQPDVIPTSIETFVSEGDSRMCIIDEDEVHPGLYDSDGEKCGNYRTRASPLGVKGPMQQWVESSVLQLNLTESNSVQQWLFDIRMNTDCESMCILQGKSIHTSPVNLEMTANTIKENVLRLKTASKCLSANFGQLHRKLSERSEDILQSCSAICKEIHCLVRECEGFFLEIPSNLFLQQQSLLQETSEFKKLIKELQSDGHGELHAQSHLTDQLLELGEQCAVFVETVQTKLIQALVYSVQDSASELNIMVSVKTVHSLITDYPSIKPILLQEQVISALFQVCLQTSFTVNSVQLLSLQTIAKFCQDTDGRIETEKIGGIGYLSQIISSPTSSESLKIEAAALISQLTSPEIVSDFRQSRFHQHLEVLLRALTDLMEQSRDPLVFLVASSAVANITFMGSIVFEFLAQDNAAKILVDGSKEGKVETLNIKDQVVTIFANMAEDQACRESIKQFEGIPLLIELLQTQVSGVETEDEKLVSDGVIRDAKLCEQIQQKSAIALARLSKDKTCAAEIEQLEGISIFSRICRTSSYRNKSVPVLIACLAALRRLHHALGPSSFHQEDIDILVRPKMIESIFSCSSMSEESFV